MGSIIEARAIISATDKTGGVFDKIAAKIEGVSKSAKAFEGIKPLGKMGWGQGFDKELDRMKLNAKEMLSIQKSWQSFNNTLMRNGPMGANKALGAMDIWKRGTLSSLREVKAGVESTERAHVRYLRTAGRFALATVAGGGLMYTAGAVAKRGVEAVAKSAAIASESASGMSKWGCRLRSRARQTLSRMICRSSIRLFRGRKISPICARTHPASAALIARKKSPTPMPAQKSPTSCRAATSTNWRW